MVGGVKGLGEVLLTTSLRTNERNNESRTEEAGEQAGLQSRLVQNNIHTMPKICFNYIFVGNSMAQLGRRCQEESGVVG